jgi:hypothetical protein
MLSFSQSFSSAFSASVWVSADLNTIAAFPFSHCTHSLPWLASKPSGLSALWNFLASIIGPFTATSGLGESLECQTAISQGPFASKVARLVKPRLLISVPPSSFCEPGATAPATRITALLSSPKLLMETRANG